MRPTQIIVDADALLNNLTVVRRYAPQQKVVAMVKADGYGHGLQTIVNILAGKVDAFGVACLEEALIIRACDSVTDIILMEGVFYKDELSVLHQHRLSCVIHHHHQLDLFMQYPQPIVVWLKVNTGMNRLGFISDDVPEAYQQLQRANVCQSIGLMTHFACADQLGNVMTEQQKICFDQISAGLAGARSLANSAAILAWPDTHADWVRPGIMLYGVSPFPDKTGAAFGLQPVMTIHSSLIAVQHCEPGSRVGYGSTWKCLQPTRIGVVAMGYGDGYPLHIKSGAPVLVNGRICPLVGRVSMDMLTVELGQSAANGVEDKVGDPVVIWGKGLPIERVAMHTQSSAYELLCNVKER